MVRSSLLHLFAAATLLGASLSSSCKDSVPADQVDNDDDKIPDLAEDRNQNGQVDPGETNPMVEDTDGDGINDDLEVSTLACSKANDRPFEVYDVPGADSMVLMDAKVSLRSTLRTMDNKTPGAALVDPDLDVGAVLLAKRPANGVATPSAQRDYERRTVLDRLGQITNQRTRAFTNVEGFASEQAAFTFRTNQPTTARALAMDVASGLLGGAALSNGPAAGGASEREFALNLLTVFRSPSRVVLLVAAAPGAQPSEAALLRVEELTDGTNVARHGSFTRHVCDPFNAKENNQIDILWVVDDSGSMEDDQMAVRTAADAMAEVLSTAQVDYRLGVARTFAQDRQQSPNRGRLEGNGLTADLNRFKQDIVVGAQGGWEPGLEVGLRAVDRLLPRTAEGAPADPQKLREGAATVIVHMSDERDQDVECAACGACPDEPEPRNAFCPGANGQREVDRFVAEYQQRGIISFAIVGDLPNGCQQSGSRDDFEPGQGYVEVANATGGHFGSLCGDMRQNVRDIALAATGIASTYQLSYVPASASLRVAMGPAGQGRVIPRSRTNGFDYDPVNNRVVFFGDARPKKGDEIAVAYRRWDWANNPNSPPDGCDMCEPGTSCNPELDVVQCETPCGEMTCLPGLACLPDTTTCGDPGQMMPPADACGGECDPGLVCNPSTTDCVPPCEQTGCVAGQICNSLTHLCQVPEF